MSFVAKNKIPPVKNTHVYLNDLLDSARGRKSVAFKQVIRAYNSIFAFTSMKTKVDRSINKSQWLKINDFICLISLNLWFMLYMGENQS